MKVSIVCNSCGGTGLYCGFAERKGEAVVCVSCKGSGCVVLEYEPFEKRKERKGINFVSYSAGTFLGTGVGSVGKKITYQEFQDGKMPE